MLIITGTISGTILISLSLIPSANSSNDKPQIIDRDPSTNIIIQKENLTFFQLITTLDADEDVLSFSWTINETSIGEDADNFTFFSNFNSAGSYLTMITRVMREFFPSPCTVTQGK